MSGNPLSVPTPKVKPHKHTLKYSKSTREFSPRQKQHKNYVFIGIYELHSRSQRACGCCPGSLGRLHYRRSGCRYSNALEGRPPPEFAYSKIADVIRRYQRISIPREQFMQDLLATNALALQEYDREAVVREIDRDFIALHRQRSRLVKAARRIRYH